MKKILIINGHPNTESYNAALAKAYKQGAEASGAEVKETTLDFCGIKPVKVTTIGPIRLSKEDYRKDWISKTQRLGQENA